MERAVSDVFSLTEIPLSGTIAPLLLLSTLKHTENVFQRNFLRFSTWLSEEFSFEIFFPKS